MTTCPALHRRIDVVDAQFAPVAPAAVAAVLWLAGFGAVVAVTVGRGSGGALIACGGPALLALVLAFTSRRDREQYVMRLCAAALMLPILMVFWALDQAPGWQLALLFALSLTAFAAATAWLATTATRLGPAPGSTAVDAAQLGQQVAELARWLGVPATPEGEHRWRIDLSPMVPAGHAQVLLLDIDGARRAVAVRERAGAVDAAPRDAAEASMRVPGDAPFDPTRPEARRVTYSSVQATQLTPERLDRVHLALDDERHIVRAEQPQPADHRDAVALFALLVTASGHAWQPRLFGGGGRRRAQADGPARPVGG